MECRIFLQKNTVKYLYVLQKYNLDGIRGAFMAELKSVEEPGSFMAELEDVEEVIN
jgi:hypothetical protein